MECRYWLLLAKKTRKSWKSGYIVWAFQAQGSGKVLKIRVSDRVTTGSLCATGVVWSLP